jgi:aryl-alcohol dehydrogenase-like predicted oxidoreductase
MTSGVESSLRRLQTDHIDLYQIHRWDDQTPIEETLRALDDLITAGKVRYIGASNFAAWQLARTNLLAEVRGWTPFVTIQNHYHMLERGLEEEMLPYCNAYGVGVLPYFPLAGGFLTGKYKRDEPAPTGSRGESSGYVQRYMTDENYAKVEKLSAWAEARGHTMAELAHTWLLAHPAVCSVISGATKVTHVQANAASADWELSESEFSEVNAVLSGES